MAPGATAVRDQPRFLRSDTPITGASEDKLLRAELADRLARRLVDYHGPQALTVGICGPWGSGKTSFVNLLKEHLEALDRTDGQVLGPVTLTPWTLATADDLASDLLVEIGRAIQLKGASKSAASTAVAVGTDIMVLGGALAAAHYAADPGWAEQFLAAVGASRAATAVKSLAKPITGRLPLPGRVPTVSERQARVSKTLAESNSLLIVALDDLERLPSDRIQEVFRVVSAIASFSNTVYVLSMDRHRAAKALDKVFDDGHAYLEKFLNLTFDLPKADPELISAMLVGRLNDILAHHDFPEELEVSQAFTNVWHGGLKDLIETPRDIVRILNSYDMALEAIAEETHPVDLLALEILRATEPAFHQSLGRDRRAVLHGLGDLMASFDKKKAAAEGKASLMALLGAVKESNQKRVERVINALFPLTQPRGQLDHSTAHRQRRATHPDYFDNYFRWSLSSDAISQKELRAKVEELAALHSDEGAKRWAKKNAERFQQVGEKLFHYLSDLGGAKVRWDFAAGVLRVAHLLDDSVGFVRSNNMLAQSLAYHAIKGDEAARAQWPSEVWERSHDTDLIYGFARFYAMALDDASDATFDAALPSEEVRSALAKRIAAVVEGGTLDNFEALGALLYRWRDIAGSAAGPREFVRNLTKSDRRDAVWTVLKRLVNVTSAGEMDILKTRHDGLNVEQISGLFDRTELAAFVQQGPLPDDQRFVEAIERALSLWADRGDEPNLLQENVLTQVVRQFMDSGEAVQGREVRQALTSVNYKAVNRALDRLQTASVWQIGMRPHESYKPTLGAVLDRDNGPVRDALQRLLEHLRARLSEKGVLPSFHWSEGLRDALGITENQRSIVLALVQLAHLGRDLTWSEDDFSFNPPDDPESIVRCQTVDDLVALVREIEGSRRPW